jgi:hypothetical protein
MPRRGAARGGGRNPAPRQRRGRPRGHPRPSRRRSSSARRQGGEGDRRRARHRPACVRASGDRPAHRRAGGLVRRGDPGPDGKPPLGRRSTRDRRARRARCVERHDHRHDASMTRHRPACVRASGDRPAHRRAGGLVRRGDPGPARPHRPAQVLDGERHAVERPAVAAGIQLRVSGAGGREGTLGPTGPPTTRRWSSACARPAR